MSDNKPPKTLWVRPVKPTTDDTPAKWPSGDQATLAYTQPKARCIPYIEPAQFMEKVERRAVKLFAKSFHTATLSECVSQSLKEIAKEIEEGKA